jgi:hypothetical protein
MADSSVIDFVCNLIDSIKSKRDLIFGSIDGKPRAIAKDDVKSYINELIGVVLNEKSRVEQSMGITPTISTQNNTQLNGSNNEISDDLDTQDTNDSQIVTDIKILESKCEKRFNRLENMIKTVLNNNTNNNNNNQIKRNNTKFVPKDCYYCHKFGHISSQCRYNPRNTRKPLDNRNKFNKYRNYSRNQQFVPQVPQQSTTHPKNWIWDQRLYNSQTQPTIPPFPSYQPFLYPNHPGYGSQGQLIRY